MRGEYFHMLVRIGCSILYRDLAYQNHFCMFSNLCEWFGCSWFCATAHLEVLKKYKQFTVTERYRCRFIQFNDEMILQLDAVVIAWLINLQFMHKPFKEIINSDQCWNFNSIRSAHFMLTLNFTAFSSVYVLFSWWLPFRIVSMATPVSVVILPAG